MQIKAMTYNIRYDTEEDGINCFNGRKDFIKEFLDREKPDVIGFQEVLPHVRKWLSENLKDYTLLGTGRGYKYDGEGVSIAFRNDKFALLKFDEFWLSDTPDVPGSIFGVDQSGCPRITAFATIAVLDSGKTFNFVCTHLDHVGACARVCGASMIMSRISKDARPFIFLGDMNEKPIGAAIKEIKSVKGVYELTNGISAKTATFHDYGRVKQNCKIDYIFSNKKAVKGTLTLHTDCKDGIYLSDHYPISVFVEI